MWTSLILTSLMIPSIIANLKVFPKQQDLHPNKLQQIYHDIRKDIYTVDTIDQLKPKELRTFGIVRVNATNSIIVSSKLADDAMNPYYAPSLDNMNLKLQQLNDFTEISFQDLETSVIETDWEPIGGCHSNLRSDTPSTYSQGWLLSVGSGVTNTISFTVNSVSVDGYIDLTYSAAISGSITCTVNPGKTLQFQIKSELVSLQNVKTRSVYIKDSTSIWGVITSNFEMGEWDKLDDYTQVNQRNFQTACVTDSTLLQCDYNSDQ
ncbi:hypothetical protein CAAN1_12S04148 [[Candida] anglica]|uniref:Uncharacterized protein n=1 Tax=[Candida] anglica TaxID=148631 RepID=A0ABP0E6R5_9ASCO